MRSRDVNKALKDWKDLKRTVALLDPHMGELLVRGLFGQGHRWELPDAEPEIGTVSTSTYSRKGGFNHWRDLTGEEAIREPEERDKVERVVIALAESIHHSLNLAKVLAQVAPEVCDFPKELVGRKGRTIPFCQACGAPCFGGARHGFDNKCRMRWERAGRPDRVEFIALMKSGTYNDVMMRRKLTRRLNT